MFWFSFFSLSLSTISQGPWLGGLVGIFLDVLTQKMLPVCCVEGTVPGAGGRQQWEVGEGRDEEDSSVLQELTDKTCTYITNTPAGIWKALEEMPSERAWLP